MDFQKVSLPEMFDGHVTKFALHKALMLITLGKLTCDERFIVHRVAGGWVVESWVEDYGDGGRV